MTPAASLPEAVARLWAADPDLPAVSIKFRPQASRWERSDLTSPYPSDVAKALCRGLDRGPGRWVAEPANARPHEHAQAWILSDPSAEGGERLAIVDGLSAVWLNEARERLMSLNWLPLARVGSGGPAGPTTTGPTNGLGIAA